jgi:hypothetical protein
MFATASKRRMRNATSLSVRMKLLLIASGVLGVHIPIAIAPPSSNATAASPSRTIRLVLHARVLRWRPPSAHPRARRCSPIVTSTNGRIGRIATKTVEIRSTESEHSASRITTAMILVTVAKALRGKRWTAQSGRLMANGENGLIGVSAASLATEAKARGIEALSENPRMAEKV